MIRWRTLPVRVLLLCAAIALLQMAAVARAAAPDFPALTGRVVDQAGLLNEAERQSLTEALKAHEEATGNQVVVVTLRSLGGLPIEDYGYQLGRAWGIGRAGKDDGVLLIVAPSERKVRIEVGYGLEGVLTDAASRLIIERVMIPSFRSGQYGPGIVAGTGAILKMLAGEGEPPALKDKPAKTSESGLVLGPLLLLLFFLILLRFVSRSSRSAAMRRRGGLPPIFFPGGWGGGGGWGDRNGGGGWGGGGGGFGGGGASGDW
jgi:uncharacterized protein